MDDRAKRVEAGRDASRPALLLTMMTRCAVPEIAEGCAAPAGSQLRLPARVRRTTERRGCTALPASNCSSSSTVGREDDDGAAVGEEKDGPSPCWCLTAAAVRDTFPVQSAAGV